MAKFHGALLRLLRDHARCRHQYHVYSRAAGTAQHLRTDQGGPHARQEGRKSARAEAGRCGHGRGPEEASQGRVTSLNRPGPGRQSFVVGETGEGGLLAESGCLKTALTYSAAVEHSFRMKYSGPRQT